ncbi:hypothetical protein DICPUDRAFT_147496 [Dictyostelium purpureum]|uniref:Uncharacterized protein n=1 Tax=Dictyostelium purpureum TaxID=5786 RepID=F0Z8N2_DICPU|nr:uncharacterized protein DICPUDRAFT_147496 [Dictyostelium purpureum]EGC39663.1 hypothetical protein DICPUDRAFT_147496 [Dictyostelium purpureum]|eukprot:XP_003283772.1 hypothetical protein DICPUDRAFT_147496 [Dictyostelium purpureum]
MTMTIVKKLKKLHSLGYQKEFINDTDDKEEEYGSGEMKKMRWKNDISINS